jgi:hypothetical protein
LAFLRLLFSAEPLCPPIFSPVSPHNRARLSGANYCRLSHFLVI